MGGDKAAIRRVLRAQRRVLSGEQIRAAGNAVASRVLSSEAYRKAGVLVAYIATENEVPVDRVVAEAWRTGRVVLLPHQGCVGFVRWQPGEALKEGAGGVPEPRSGQPELLSGHAVVLVPVVGWDATGSRLGRGGGFYDRVLAAVPAGVTVVGIAYEFQEYSSLPRDPWDVAVDFVITERRTVPTPGGGHGYATAMIQEGGCRRDD